MKENFLKYCFGSFTFGLAEQNLIMFYFKLFFIFLKIGLFTIGGGYAMLPLIEREVVQRKWLSQEEFYDLFAVAQSLPGVFAVNISIFVGYKLRKMKGGLACALGATLPSFLIILIVATVFTQIQDNDIVIRIFKGLRPAVVALIVAPCITAAKASNITYKTVIIPIAGALLIWLGGISPVYIILGACLGGLIYTFYLKKV